MTNGSIYLDSIKNYSSEWLTEAGYNRCYFDAKKYTDSPSLYAVAAIAILKFLTFNSHSNFPDDAFTKSLLKECKKVNSLKIELASDGSWNKQVFFDYLKSILTIIASSEFENSIIKDSNEYADHFIKILNLSYNKTQKTNKTLFPLFNDVVGLEKAKKVVKERIIDPALHRDIFEKYGVQVGGGILLFGLPGTGKTMFAQAVANEIDGCFINVKSSDIKSKYYGETENKIKEIFEEAQKHKVAVIFFDEFEAIGVSRDKRGSEITASSVVPELLTQLQGFHKRSNIVLVIAATNRPWDIDSALLRPGRLDSLIYVDLPNYEARKQIITKNLSKIHIEDDIIEYIAHYTEGYNGADLKDIADHLIRLVIGKEIEQVENYEITFEDCVEVLKENKSSVSPNDVRQMMCFIETNNM